MFRARSTLSLPANISYYDSSFNEHVGQCHTNFKNKGVQNVEFFEVSQDNKDPNTFSSRYKEICNSMHTQPLNMVRVLKTNESLDLICDKIKYIDMMAILRCIREDRSLHLITLKSNLKGFVVQEYINTERKAREADKVLYTRYMVNQMAESLRECLTYSLHLSAIGLNKIPFRGSSMEILCQGLKNTQTLQHLSLQDCDIRDEGCLELSRALRNVPTIITIDLTSCNLTEEGARHIANLMKAQEIARFDQSWKQSLRYREVNNDAMVGLRRVTLNDNPNIGDEGLKIILDVLMDDFWIRALDVQNCGLTNNSGLLALEVVKTNTEIGVLDLRRNLDINRDIITAILKTVSKHMTPEKAEYGWLDIPKKRDNTSTTPSNTTISSLNGGPGNKKNKKGSSKNIDVATKMAIRKVKEWNELKIDGKTSECFTPNNIIKGVDKGIQIEDQSSGSNLSSNSMPDIVERSDESQIETNGRHHLNVKQRNEDIPHLFCKYINSSPFDDGSDSDSQKS